MIFRPRINVGAGSAIAKIKNETKVPESNCFKNWGLYSQHHFQSRQLITFQRSHVRHFGEYLVQTA